MSRVCWDILLAPGQWSANIQANNQPSWNRPPKVARTTSSSGLSGPTGGRSARAALCRVSRGSGDFPANLKLDAGESRMTGDRLAEMALSFPLLRNTWWRLEPIWVVTKDEWEA